MLSRRLLVRKHLTCLIKQTRCSSQVAIDPETAGGSSQIIRLSPVKAKQPTREPFVKNLFLGKFDIEFLIYPEAQTSERHRDFFEWLKPIEEYIKKIDVREIDITSKVKNEIFDELEKLGVFRASIDESYGGLGLGCSEYAKLVETVSAVPILATYLIKRATIINLINKYGTEKQKSDILPKIASGEIIPALCFSENSTGSTSEPLIGKSVISDCRTFYTVNTRKTWVFDATRANLFVILTQSSSSDAFVKLQSFGAFLIPKNTKGINIEEPVSILGQHGIDICNVNFTDVVIPADAQLGKKNKDEELFITMVGEDKLYVGAQAVGILKHFLNNLTTTVINSKNFNAKKNAEDSMHETIGKIASTLYAMEATTYMTAGMIDNFEKQDSTVEKSLVACYCTNACIEEILWGMQALGSSGYLMSEPFEKIVRDAFVMSNSDRLSMDTKIFAALLGLQYTGTYLGDEIKKLRNPTQNPLHALRDALRIERQRRLYLDENLHPTLRTAAQSLESSCHKLKSIVHTLFTRHGIELLSQRMEIRKLADILIEIYAMTAVVSRASRSYCIGLRNSEHEVKVAALFTYHTFEKVNMLFTNLNDGDLANGDIMLKDIAESIFQKKEYFASHPLERNF